MKPTSSINRQQISSVPRNERVGRLIQRTLAVMIQQKTHHVKLSGWVTIADVLVTKDLRDAKIYFTVLCSALADLDPQHVAKELNTAAPYFRTHLAKELNLRVVPRLYFRFDESIEYGRQLSHVIGRA